MATCNELRIVGAGLALVVVACGNGASAEADEALGGVTAGASVGGAVDDGRDSAVVRDRSVRAAESAEAAPQRSSADPFVGRWEGRLEGHGTAVITRPPEGYSVEIAVETSPPPESGFLPCMGGIEGKARLEGEQLVLTQTQNGATCRIIMRRSDGSLLVEVADFGCMSYHGISCGFSGTLQRSGTQSSNRPAPRKLRNRGGLRAASGLKVAASTVWRATAKTDPARVHLEAIAHDGRTRLSGGCNNLLQPGFVGTIFDYPGQALKRVDQGEEPVVFEINGPDGNSSFRTRVWYHAYERAWPLIDFLPPAFFEALAQGNTLTIRNDGGVAVAVFDLQGAARAVQLVEQFCSSHETENDRDQEQITSLDRRFSPPRRAALELSHPGNP